MKIDRHTLNEELAPLLSILTDEDMGRVRAAAVRDKYGDAGFYGMTVGDFTTVIGGDVRPLLQSGGRTVFDTCRVEAFREWVDELSATLRRLTVPPTAESIRLNAGTLPCEFTESVYFFCRSYFNLPSFEAADTLKVSEFVMAKKDDYNHAVVDRNVSAMMKGGKQ
jgi:hypothetical protein